MTRSRVLVDTGPLVALVSRDDAQHRLCVDSLGTLQAPLFTCWPVLTEAAWLLRHRPEAFQKLLSEFGTGLFALLPLGPEAVVPIAQILRRYQSLGAQLADAALVHLADREAITSVFTLDRRDFSVYRLKRNRTLNVLPEVP
ncbi:MAG: PIN domain-containing protein [Isosphaeraceae bacterium]